MSPPTKTTNKSNIGNHETTESNQKDDMNHQKDDATASSRTTLKLKRAVPEIVSMEIKQKYQKGLEKQRQLLANLIFPSHIPSPCHPNVSSLAEVIRDLKEILTRKESESKSGGGGGSDSCTSEEKCPTSSSNLFSKQDIELLGRNPRGGTTERFVTPLQEILRVHEKCDVYLRRAKHYEMLAKKQQQNEKLTKENKNALLETVSMSKIFQMNYRYCIASVSCPKRVAILNNCYSQYPPEVVQAMVKAGQHEFLCTKERKAVERCCGQKVQSLVRNLHER